MSSGRLNFPAGLLNQTAVYWSNPQSDGMGGRTFAEPVEIKARWEDRQELFIDASGQEARSRAVVHVSEDVVIGGYLYLGTLADLSSAEEADPLSLSESYEIRAYAKIPNLAADQFLRKVWL